MASRVRAKLASLTTVTLFVGVTTLGGILSLSGSVEDLPSTQLPQTVLYFLAFTVLVAVILILVLNHLLQRARMPKLTSPDRLFDYVDEALVAGPADLRVMDVAAVCIDNGLFERALVYLDRLSPAMREEPRAKLYLVLALVGTARIEQATSLYRTLSLERLEPRERDFLESAMEEHGAFARLRKLLLSVFLMDLTFDEGEGGRSQPSLIDETRGLGPEWEYLARSLPRRYRTLRYLRRDGSEHVISAFDRDLNRRVRLRIMGEPPSTEESMRAFVTRAQQQGQGDVPRTARVYDIHKQRLPCYTLEEIDGSPFLEWIADPARDLAGALGIFLKVWQLGKSLVKNRHPLPRLEDLVIDPAGEVWVQELGDESRSPEESFLGTLRVLVERFPAPPAGPGGATSYLEMARDRLVEALRSTRTAAEVISALESHVMDITRYLNLSKHERVAEGCLRNLRWYDDLHRALIHAIKSKFGIFERYRDEPEKLIRSFFRKSNLAEVAALLSSVKERVAEIDRLPPFSDIQEIKELVTGLPTDEMLELVLRFRNDLETDGSVPEIKPEAAVVIVQDLGRFSAYLRDMSRRMAVFVEAYEVDLGRLIEGVAGRSPYSGKIRLSTVGLPGRLRVAWPEEFRKELAVVIDNLVANAFEAHASSVEIRIHTPAGVPHFDIEFIDDGEGVSEGLLEKIRRDRYSTKADGTGTGVSYSLEILEKYSGHLFLDPRGDTRGTVAKIHLPNPNR